MLLHFMLEGRKSYVCATDRKIYIVNTLTFVCTPFFQRRGGKGKKEMKRDRHWREGEYEISYSYKLCKEHVNLLKRKMRKMITKC